MRWKARKPITMHLLFCLNQTVSFYLAKEPPFHVCVSVWSYLTNYLWLSIAFVSNRLLRTVRYRCCLISVNVDYCITIYVPVIFSYGWSCFILLMQLLGTKHCVFCYVVSKNSMCMRHLRHPCPPNTPTVVIPGFEPPTHVLVNVWDHILLISTPF